RTNLYTEEQGRKLGLVGWVKNTANETVTGQVQGPKEKVEIMKNWLRSIGSPCSQKDIENISEGTVHSSLESRQERGEVLSDLQVSVILTS
uniref:acylphosphatase n=1 Tax=Naja naja TaxID=35670 RepID=A0A8C6VDM2_NAJNA